MDSKRDKIDNNGDNNNRKTNGTLNENKTNIDMETEKTNKEEKNKNIVDLDTILVEELGQFGVYQLRTAIMVAIIVTLSAWASVEYIFTTARIRTRCLIPECESLPSEFLPSWLENAVPISDSGFDNCQRYANLTTGTETLEGTCPAALFDKNRLVDCEDYVYENNYSVVYDLNLACDEWRRSLIGSVRTAGVFFATPVTGFISDRWGRRTALALGIINTAWLGTVRYFSDTYIGFVASEVAEAFFGSGAFSCAYILMMELVGPKIRVAVGATMNTFFAVGQVTMGLIAWGVPYWRNLTLTLYLPMFITIPFCWLMSESTRWYMSKGRFQDSEKVLKKIARVNKKQLSHKSLELLRISVENERMNQEIEKQRKANEPWLIVKVFKHKSILLRCAVSPLWWITTTFIYYGLSINAVNLSGNRYLNYVAVAAVEIPGYWISFLLMSRIGRKPVLTGAFWVCAACQIGYIFIPDGLNELSLALYLIGKCSIAMVVTTVYVYTAELYPTEYRHSLFAFSFMMGRIGSILAPLTPALGTAVWDDLPFVLFGGLALISGGLVLLTPETLGTRLPDTMHQANDLGAKKQEE